jgi:hypothetical protein
MGTIAWPTSGAVYLDANGFIYSVERIDPYRAILDSLWQAVSTGRITGVTGELNCHEQSSLEQVDAHFLSHRLSSIVERVQELLA